MRFLNSSLYPILWFLLFMIPVVTTLSSVDSWDISPWYLVAVSTWYILFAASLLGRNTFVLVTFPVVLLGIVVVVGDFHRNVNVLELMTAFDTYSTAELLQSIAPYRYWLVLLLAVLIFVAVGVRISSATYGVRWRYRIALAAVGLVLALSLPASSWIRAWPATVLSVAFAQQAGDQSLLAALLPFASVDPREGSQPWDARREIEIDVPELYVLVIGESVRPERLAECGGRPGVHALAPEAIVYCDVLAGSSSTYTSVPLLISRDIPGLDRRIPRDASFISAFKRLGFSSWWLTTQQISIAWPEVHHQRSRNGKYDRDRLMPLVEEALASDATKKLLVLHAYNAHFNYADRYPPEEAAFPVTLDLNNRLIEREHLDEWWNAYDNAVSESMKFLDSLIARIDREPGHVFLLYTSDHGENMLDDDRDLTDHALNFPTIWDTRVPAVVWANARWRNDKAEKFAYLLRNRERPLMHLDLIPTLLGAADIVYPDARELPVDLTTAVVGNRTRFVQKRLGEIVTEADL